MNQATREYMDALDRAHRIAEQSIAETGGDRSAYYPCFAGALQALLGDQIERRHGESIDWQASRAAKAQMREKAA